MARKRSRCKCTYGYCCDFCWAQEAKENPCKKTPRCEQPDGHGGPCGELKNTQTITFSAENFLR